MRTAMTTKTTAGERNEREAVLRGAFDGRGSGGYRGGSGVLDAALPQLRSKVPQRGLPARTEARPGRLPARAWPGFRRHGREPAAVLRPRARQFAPGLERSFARGNGGVDASVRTPRAAHVRTRAALRVRDDPIRGGPAPHMEVRREYEISARRTIPAMHGLAPDASPCDRACC